MCTDVGLNGVSDTETIKLSLRNLAPDVRNVYFFCVILGAVDADDVIRENLDRVDVVIALGELAQCHISHFVVSVPF